MHSKLQRHPRQLSQLLLGDQKELGRIFSGSKTNELLVKEEWWSGRLYYLIRRIGNCIGVVHKLANVILLAAEFTIYLNNFFLPPWWLLT